MNKKVNLYGAGGHAKGVWDVITANGIDVCEIADDSQLVNTFLQFPVKRHFDTNLPVIIAVGNNYTRKIIAESNGYTSVSVIHPSAVISPFATLQEGTVVMPLVSVKSCSNIGKHCILNALCAIGHDCEIGSFVHIAPHATLCGNVTVGEGSWIGANATVIQGIKIGRWVTIGAGAVIIKDVPDYAVVVGNPGRIIKYKNEKDN